PCLPRVEPRGISPRILLRNLAGLPPPATARSAAQRCAVHFHIDHQPREVAFPPANTRAIYCFPGFPAAEFSGWDIPAIFLQTVSNSGNLSQSLANRPGG